MLNGVKDEISKTKFMGENGELLMGFSIFSIEIVSILCHFMPLAPPPLPNLPFAQFDFSQLNQETVFNTVLKNRSLAYFGENSYSYNGIKHNSNPIPVSDKYLCTILEQPLSSTCWRYFPDITCSNFGKTSYLI